MADNITPALAARLVRVEPGPKGGAIVATSGMQGSGKTGFALTGPEAVLYIGMDRQLKGEYIDDLLRSRKIYAPKTNFQPLDDKKKFNQAFATKIWDEFIGLWKDGCSDKSIRTLVPDTGTYMWALARMNHLGKLTQVMPYHYVEVNSAFSALFRMAEDANKVVIVPHAMSKEYKTNKEGKDAWTGRYERAGFSHIDFVSNIILHHYRTKPNADEIAAGVQPEFGVEIVQNKLKPETDGMTLTGEQCEFAYLSALTWPE